MRIASMRDRFTGRLFCSFRYASRGPSVQLPKGKSSACGLISAIAMTSIACVGVYVAGRPARICQPSPPISTEAFQPVAHGFVAEVQFRSDGRDPLAWLASQTVRARSTSRPAAVGE